MRAKNKLTFTIMKKKSEEKLPKKRKTANYKAGLVLELLRGEPIEEIARREKLSVSELMSWKAVFIKQGSDGFKKNPEESRLKEAKRVIADLAMENALYKKKMEWLREQEENS